MDLDQLLEGFEADVRLTVATSARRRTFVHAGVVGWRGRAIVLPGRSFSGKTTLVAELVRAGASYYSDEFAVFDSRGRVHPFPKPLSVRERTDHSVRKVPAEALGGTPGQRSLPVGVVVLSEYRAGARWRPRALTSGRALLALLAHAVPVRHEPERSLATLEQVITGASILKGVRGEAGTVAEKLLHQVEGAR